jgi:hypothetical protein
MPHALDPEEEAAADARAAAVEALWGHPQHRWDELTAIIQNTGVTDFDAIRVGWLELMWCLDRYRVADAPPSGMGNAHLPYGSRMDASTAARAIGSRSS